ncbi:MAG: hypothetical protein RLZZ352_2360 [Pseudomonadota bacterium]|jgi:outer membrane protein/protease secretion system outer membrane protein
MRTVFFAGLLACSLVHAQDAAPPAQALGLAQVYAHALAHDATLRATRAQADGVDERVAQARAQLKPRMSFNATRFYNDLDRTQPNLLGQPTATHEGYYSSSQSLQLRQPLYRPALSWGVDVALAQQAEAQAVLSRAVQNLGVEVAEAYLQVLLAQEEEQLLGQQIHMTQQQKQSAEKRLAAGQGIRTDIDEAQARMDGLAAQQLQARQARQTALLQIQSMTQQALEAVHPLQPQALDTAEFLVQTPADWMDKAQARSPELRALQARLDAARFEVQRAQTGHQPTLDALLQISRSVSDTVSSTQTTSINRQLGFQLEIPLYAGGAVQSAVRQALFEQTRTEELLEAGRRDLNIRIQREWRGVTESTARMHALTRAVASADLVVVSAKRSFETGFRTVLDVLNAEERAHQARRDLMEARLSYVTHRLRLLSLAGELDMSQIQQADRWFQP